MFSSENYQSFHLQHLEINIGHCGERLSQSCQNSFLLFPNLASPHQRPMKHLPAVPPSLALPAARVSQAVHALIT